MSVNIHLLLLHHRRAGRRHPLQAIPNQAGESIRIRNICPEDIYSELSGTDTIAQDNQESRIVWTSAAQIFAGASIAGVQSGEIQKHAGYADDHGCPETSVYAAQEEQPATASGCTA